MSKKHLLRIVSFSLATLLVFMTGCGSKSRASADYTLPKVRVAVLDGITNYEVSPKGDVEDNGWWFSARNRYKSANIGIQLGQALADEMQGIQGVEIYPREDLSIYYAQKERLLERAYPDLEPAERKQLLSLQDPVDYGRSLGMDYVVTSKINSSSTLVNRTTSIWLSTLEAEVAVIRVSDGQTVDYWTWRDSDYFDSQLSMVEECARELTRKARKSGVFLSNS